MQLRLGRMSAVNVSDCSAQLTCETCGCQPRAHDEIILTNLRGNRASFHHLHSPSWIPSWLCWLSLHVSNSVNFLIKLKRKLLLLGRALLSTYWHYFSLSTHVIIKRCKMIEKIRENNRICVFCSHSVLITGCVSTRSAVLSDGNVGQAFWGSSDLGWEVTHGEVLAVLCVEIVCWMVICAGKCKEWGKRLCCRRKTAVSQCVKTNTHLYYNSSVCVKRESTEVYSGIRSRRRKGGRAYELKGFCFLRKAAIQ